VKEGVGVEKASVKTTRTIETAVARTGDTPAKARPAKTTRTRTSTATTRIAAWDFSQVAVGNFGNFIGCTTLSDREDGSRRHIGF